MLGSLRGRLSERRITVEVSDEAKAFQPHYAAHKKHLQERLDQLDAGLRNASGDEAAYQALVEEIAASKPIPCLSFACPEW